MLARSVRCLWLFVGGLLLFAVALCGRLVAGSSAPAPLLCWEVTPPAETGSRLFVLGATHAGRAPIDAFDPAIEAAFAESEALVLEANVLAVDTERFQRFVREAGTIADGGTLADRLSPDVAAALARHLSEHGLRPDAYAQHEPWLASLELAWDALLRHGFEPRHGMERYFLDRIGQREIVELEGAATQIEQLDHMTASGQAFMLAETLRTLEDVEGWLARIEALWRAGDPDGLAELLFAGEADDPARLAFLEAVYFGRNAAMAERLEDALRVPGVRFAVLGAGHVVGERGIPALLEARGYRVRQLRTELRIRRAPHQGLR